MKFRILLASIFVTILVSCTTVDSTKSTAVVIPSYARTPLPPSQTLKPTITPIPIALQTFTPLPTLARYQKLRLVEELLINNANCKLPCWWGMIPGKTKWQVSQNFLSTFSNDIISVKSQEKTIHVVIISVSEAIASSRYLFQRYYDQNGIIETIETSTGQTEIYSLSNIMTNYGQPTEVWISWINTKPNTKGYFPIFVILYYQNQGILVEYSPNRLSVTENTVIGCPQEYVYPDMFLWSPESGIGNSFSEILNQTDFNFAKELKYLPLIKATGMNVEEFYSIFRNKQNISCIETPISLWEKGNNPFP